MDDAARQTFAELQDGVLNYRQSMKMVQSQAQNYRVNAQRSTLTKQELDSLPDDTVMYNAVGKAYFFTPKNDITGRLESGIKGNISDLENLKVQAEGISAKLKQAESEFNEFLDMTTKRAGM